MRGTLVASGSVPDGDGAAVWKCPTLAAGSYLLGIFDGEGTRLAALRFVKL